MAWLGLGNLGPAKADAKCGFPTLIRPTRLSGASTCSEPDRVALSLVPYPGFDQARLDLWTPFTLPPLIILHDLYSTCYLTGPLRPPLGLVRRAHAMLVPFPINRYR